MGELLTVIACWGVPWRGARGTVGAGGAVGAVDTQAEGGEGEDDD